MLQLNEIESFEFDDRMSDSDALMWSIEKDPLLRSTIVTVSTFEGRLDHDRVRNQIDYLSRVIPRFRQRVRANPLSIAPPRWEFDPYFDLSYHLRFVTVSEGATLADVLTMAEPIGMQGFDRARPLWEATIVDGLADGTTALILKIHPTSRPASSASEPANAEPPGSSAAITSSVSSPATVPRMPSRPERSTAEPTTCAQPGGVDNTTSSPLLATATTHSPNTRRRWSAGATWLRGSSAIT